MNGQQVTRLTREELYQRVWSTPASRLCREFGVSGRGLAKICERHHIPCPPRGYWAKSEVGKKVPQAPLPPLSDSSLKTVVIKRTESHPAQQAESNLAYDEDIAAVLERVRALPRVEVGDELRNLHPLVQTTQMELKNAVPDSSNLFGPNTGSDSAPSLSVLVGRDNIRSALLFLNALLKAVESVGGEIKVETRDQWTFSNVYVCGETVTTFRLRERCKKVPKGEHKQGRGTWGDNDYVPTGKLVLGCGDTTYYCQDSDRNGPIESQINDLIERWAKKAQEVRTARRQLEEYYRRRDEEERARQERRKCEQIERARVERLLTDSQAWKQNQSLRSYIAAVEAAARERSGKIDPFSEMSEWLNWARGQAAVLDPVEKTVATYSCINPDTIAIVPATGP